MEIEKSKVEETDTKYEPDEGWYEGEQSLHR